jgi:anti-anti-sigma factor
MSGRLEISVEERRTGGSSVAVVRVSGEVDLSNADQLADALRAEAVQGASGAVVDLSAVPFMDSSGLRVLLMAASDGASELVAVLTPDSPVARLLDLAEVGERVRVFSAEQEALEALPAGGSDQS